MTRTLLWSLFWLFLLISPALAEVSSPPVPTEQEQEETEASNDSLEELQTDSNPLNPAGDSLDKLLQLRVNDDLWKAMLGELPCLEATESCIKDLQNMAVERSQSLQAIQNRIDAVNSKIEEARNNNRSTVALGVFEPLLQSWLKTETVALPNGQQQQRGFLENVLGAFLSPIEGINEIFSLIGLPLFRNAIGGDAAAQQRSIAIADLQVKIAEVERQKGELTAKIREQVLLQVIDFDQTRREFQVSQEVVRREALRLRLIEVSYRFGQGETNDYLRSLSSMDRQKAQTFREWAKLRRQLTRIKLLVLGAD